MAQLEIITTAQQGQLTINDVELEKAVKEELKKYEIEVTEDNIADAKKARATLNKVSKALDDKRVEIKKEYCVPLDEFESKVKRIKALIDDGAKNISEQLNVFEEQCKQDKQMEITEYFASLSDAVVPLEKIWNDKWLNKTCNDWKEEINSKISTINEELDIINSFGISEEEKEEVKGYYLDCLNISEARAQFDAQKERREQLKKIQEQKQSQDTSNHHESIYKQPAEMKHTKEAQQVKKERILVEFVVEGREFLDYLNEAIKMYKPKVKIIEREELK
ncbi:MAG: DUF1351 domain-containing protein [Longibaculum sp.]